MATLNALDMGDEGVIVQAVENDNFASFYGV